nr:unnamed protein product [Spirometra erinaceieuropaei]
MYGSRRGMRVPCATRLTLAVIQSDTHFGRSQIQPSPFVVVSDAMQSHVIWLVGDSWNNGWQCLTTRLHNCRDNLTNPRRIPHEQ